MKRFFRLIPALAVALLSATCFVPTSQAKERDATDVVNTDQTTALDTAEEARKVLRLAKLVLHSDAGNEIKTAFSEEIKFVEKNKALKEAVVTHLLEDDNSDPSLPKAHLVKYQDGSVRGILFVQSDASGSKTPNRIAWAFDNKREKREHGGQ